MIIWVIGAGGLLGSAVVRQAKKRSDTVITSSQIPWSNSAETIEEIHRDAASLRDQLTNRVRPGTKWAIVWAAGHATTASSQEETDRELTAFRGCVHAINEELRNSPNGTFALASSAGAVYAGSANPPFSSSSPVQPLGPYGWLKVQQEEASRDLLDSAIDTVMVRIANLYGPGQDLTKLQGLISRLALSSVTREPLTMFVPLDTMRDYITADDAATRLLHWVDVKETRSSIRVVASGQATSLGFIINVMKDVTRVPLPIAYGLHASAAHQSSDLRLIPDRDQTVDGLPLTPTAVGIKRVYDDVLWRAMHKSDSLSMHIW